VAGKSSLSIRRTRLWEFPPIARFPPRRTGPDEEALRCLRQLGWRLLPGLITRGEKPEHFKQALERKTLSIAERAISALIFRQGLGDLYRIYLITQRDGVAYNLAYIPATFNEPHREDFDIEYMRRLFHQGYEMAVRGYPWVKVPPGYDLSSE